MITIFCSLKTCQAKNDKEATQCWNCGGPMPETVYNSPALAARLASAEAQRIMAKADPYRENPAPPAIQKTKLKTYAAKDVTIVLKGAGPNGEDLEFRENEEGHWVADGAIQNITVTGYYAHSVSGDSLDVLGAIYGVRR